MQVAAPVRGGIMRSAIRANKHAVIGETVPMGRALFITVGNAAVAVLDSCTLTGSSTAACSPSTADAGHARDHVRRTAPGGRSPRCAGNAIEVGGGNAIGAKIAEPRDVPYRIKRGLAGYGSYLAACEMNQAFSD